MSKTDDSKKEPRIHISSEGLRVTKTDYAGFVALILTGGFVALLILGRVQEAAILGPFAGWFLRHYFFGFR